MIYHNYDDIAGVVELSAGSWVDGWMTRRVLEAMYRYPFDEVQCQAVVNRVSDDNVAMHRMLSAYGYERYRIPRLRGRNKAENLFVLTREAWEGNRFMRGKNGGKVSS